VCTTSVLTNSIERRNNVVIGVIFQHSAAIVLVPYRAGINAVSELKGRLLMDTPGSDDIAAMLKHEGVDYHLDLPRVTHSGDPRDLLRGKADAMIAYSTNESYLLEQYGPPTGPSRRPPMASTFTATTFAHRESSSQSIPLAYGRFALPAARFDETSTAAANIL
jgi:hypothetical protein